MTLATDTCHQCAGLGEYVCRGSCDAAKGHVHVCGACLGNGRISRGPHDPRSAIDFDAEGRELERLRARVAELDDIRALVDAQAEDEGLWFRAERAPEAYLQRALRELHALIERADKPEGGP